MKQEIWDFEQADDIAEYKKPNVDEKTASNSAFPLFRTLESLEKQIAKQPIEIQEHQNVDSVPFDYLQLLMNKKTTSV